MHSRLTLSRSCGMSSVESRQPRGETPWRRGMGLESRRPVDGGGESSHDPVEGGSQGKTSGSATDPTFLLTRPEVPGISDLLVHGGVKKILK